MAIIEIEKEKRRQLDLLYSDLRKQVSTKPKILFSDGKYYNPAEYLCEDGFYPGYFNAKRKVLFLGREARGVSGCNRVDNDLQKYFPETNIERVHFWSRIFYINYGIKKEGKLAFKDLPPANDIKEEARKTNDFGFALMNVSKYSNDNDNWKADKKLIHRFFEDSEIEKRNYLKEELDILEPDIVVSAHLWDSELNIGKYMNLVFPPESCFDSEEKSSGKYSAVWEFSENKKPMLLIELYHFSAPKVKDNNNNKWLTNEELDKVGFYDPVMKAVFAK